MVFKGQPESCVVVSSMLFKLLKAPLLFLVVTATPESSPNGEGMPRGIITEDPWLGPDPCGTVDGSAVIMDPKGDTKAGRNWPLALSLEGPLKF